MWESSNSVQLRDDEAHGNTILSVYGSNKGQGWWGRRHGLQTTTQDRRFLPAGGKAPAEEEKRHTRQRDGFGGGWAGGEITWLAAGASDCSCAKLTSAGTYRRLPSPQNGPREGCQLFATRIGQWKCRSGKDGSKLKQPAKTGEKVSWNPKENLWEKQKKMQNKRY